MSTYFLALPLAGLSVYRSLREGYLRVGFIHRAYDLSWCLYVFTPLLILGGNVLNLFTSQLYTLGVTCFYFVNWAVCV